MKNTSNYSRCRIEDDAVEHNRDISNKRVTIGALLWDRISRWITLPIYVISMFFILAPSFLIILELSGRIFADHELIGGFAFFFGLLLCFFIIILTLIFCIRDLSFQRSFLIFWAVFLFFVSIGDWRNDHSLSIIDLGRRYKNSFFTIVELYQQQPYIPYENGDRRESYQYTSIDSLAINMSKDPSVEAFAAYASKKHFDDDLSRGVYFRACEILSLYRTIIEDFGTTGDHEAALNPDPQEILAYMEASHSELTIYFAACLMSLDYLVRVRENLQGRLVTEISISTSTYFDLGNFFVHGEWGFIQLQWYMNEFIIEEPGIDSFILPLYIPI